MRAMSAQAIGGYFRELVDRRGATQAAISQQIGVAPNYLYRLETGDTQEPSARIIIALVRALRAPLAHVQQLLDDPHATAEQGRALARRIFEEPEPTLTPDQEEFLRNLTPAQRRAILDLAREMQQRLQ